MQGSYDGPAAAVTPAHNNTETAPYPPISFRQWLESGGYRRHADTQQAVRPQIVVAQREQYRIIVYAHKHNTSYIIQPNIT